MFGVPGRCFPRPAMLASNAAVHKELLLCTIRAPAKPIAQPSGAELVRSKFVIDILALFALVVGMVPVDPKPARLVALAVSQEPFAPCHLLPISEKTHTRAILFQSKLLPIPSPNPAKLIQARPN